MKVGKRPNVVSRFCGYLKALNTFGKVTTALSMLFSVAQILEFFFPALVQSPFSDSKYVTIALSVAFAILLLVVVWSNFTLFDTHTSQGVAIEAKEPSVHVSDWLPSRPQERSLNPDAKLVFRTRIEVCNDQSRRTSLRLTVDSLKWRWGLGEETALTDVRTYLSGCTAQGGECKGDQVSVPAWDTATLSLDVHAPLSILGDEGGFRRLGSLSAVTVNLAIRESGRKPRAVSIDCGVCAFHRAIQDRLRSEISHLYGQHRRPAQAQQLADISEEYWKGYAGGH